MCEPVTILAVSGLVMSAVSSVQQGNAAKSAGRYNAREAENEATRTRNKGTEEENKQRQRVSALASRQRAALGASGVDIDSGSAAAIQEDTKLFGEVDALRIRTNFQDRAGSLDRGAELTRAQGDSAQRAGQFKAAGSLLSAAGAGVSSKWYTPDSSAVTTISDGSQFANIA